MTAEQACKYESELACNLTETSGENNLFAQWLSWDRRVICYACGNICDADGSPYGHKIVKLALIMKVHQLK